MLKFKRLTGDEGSKSDASQGLSREMTCMRTRRTKSDKTQAQLSDKNAANTLILRGLLGDELGTISSSGITNDRISAAFWGLGFVPGMLLEIIWL